MAKFDRNNKIALALALIVLALLFVLNFKNDLRFVGSSPPVAICPNDFLKDADSMDELVKRSSIIVKGTVVRPDDMPEVALEPVSSSDITLKVGERLKGDQPRIGDQIKLCPKAISFYISSNPVIVFIAGREKDTNYWVPTQGFETSFGEDVFYQTDFKNDKDKYTLDEIRRAIKEQK